MDIYFHVVVVVASRDIASLTSSKMSGGAIKFDFGTEGKNKTDATAMDEILQ